MPGPQGPPRGPQPNSPPSGQSQAGGQSQESSFAHIKFGKPLDPELFNGIAKDAAKKVADADRDRNKSTQLSRF